MGDIERHPMPKHKANAFTLVELLIAIGIIAVLIGILIPVIGKTRESAKRLACANNLRQIGLSVTRYGVDYKELPRTIYHNGVGFAGVLPSAFSGRLCDDQFAGAGGESSDVDGADNKYPKKNDVTAALFLLVRLKYLTAESFVCPSSGATADLFGGELPTKRGNFTGRANLSYSYANPYPIQQSNNQYGYYYGTDMDQRLPLAADLNPGDSSSAPTLSQLTLNSSHSDLRNGNSQNHSRAGQNVAYYDGHVDWCTSSFVGIGSDNIFTRTYSDPPPADQGADPADPFGSSLQQRHSADSLLLPTATSTGISAN